MDGEPRILGLVPYESTARLILRIDFPLFALRSVEGDAFQLHRKVTRAVGVELSPRTVVLGLRFGSSGDCQRSVQTAGRLFFRRNRGQNRQSQRLREGIAELRLFYLQFVGHVIL